MRTQGWETRLAKLIEAKRKLPFKWGEHDCSLFALDCLDAQCETELAANWRGKYKTPRGAYGQLERNGGYSSILESYGLIKQPIEKASRGDLAFIGGELAMGVVVGDTVISTGLNGLVSLPINKALHIWSLPPCRQ